MWNDGIKTYIQSGLNRDEEIAEAIEKILHESKQPTRYEIGVYSTCVGNLGHYYGQQGCCELIETEGESGWEKIGYSLTGLFCEFIISSAANFPVKKHDFEIMSLVYFASLATENTKLQHDIAEIILSPTLFGIEESWMTQNLTSLVNFAAGTDYPHDSFKVTSQYFAPMIRASHFDSRRDAIDAYLKRRRDLVDTEGIPDPFGVHPFMLLPIELFVFRDWLEEYSQKSRSGLKKFFLAEKPQFKFEFNDELRQIYDIICAKSKIDLRLE